MPPPVLAPHSSLSRRNPGSVLPTSPQSLRSASAIPALLRPPPGSRAPACKPCAVPCKPRASHLHAHRRRPCLDATRARPLLAPSPDPWRACRRGLCGSPSKLGAGATQCDLPWMAAPLPWKARSATIVCASHSILSGHGMHRAHSFRAPAPVLSSATTPVVSVAPQPPASTPTFHPRPQMSP